MAAVAPPPPPDPVDDAPPLPVEPPPPAPNAQDDIAAHSTPVQHYGSYYAQAAAPYAHANSCYSAPQQAAAHGSYVPAHAYYGQYAPQQAPSYGTTSAQWASAYAVAPVAAAPASQPYGAYAPAYGAAPPHSAQMAPLSGGVASGAYAPAAPSPLAPPAPLPAPGGVTFSLPARPRPVAPGAMHSSSVALPDPRGARRQFGNGPQLASSTKPANGASAYLTTMSNVLGAARTAYICLLPLRCGLHH